MCEDEDARSTPFIILAKKKSAAVTKRSLTTIIHARCIHAITVYYCVVRYITAISKKAYIYICRTGRVLRYSQVVLIARFRFSNLETEINGQTKE